MSKHNTEQQEASTLGGKPVTLKYTHYYLTLFKVEGSIGWRASMPHKTDTGFEEEIAKTMRGVNITNRKLVRIDRLTGAIEVIEKP